MKILQCLKCGKEFERNSSRHKYCSKDCRRKVWDKKNHHKVINSKQIYRDKNKDTPLQKIKNKARQLTRSYPRDKCKVCGSYIHLQFHHINYITCEGFVVCRKCHVKLHPRK